MSYASNSTNNLTNSANNTVVPSPNQSAPQQGSETRTSILPSMVPSGIGFFGSPYSPANAMMTPPQIGVEVGDSMDSVINAVKGVGFYADQIGFGAPSTGLTQGMPLQPLGVNYFMKTGLSCSNGADMWQYMQGITQGDALGEKLKMVMAEMGLPPLKGLAPGMIEDAENALNPSPLINAMFGSGYPQCKQVTLAVGDSYGRIADPDTGEVWIADPDTATNTGNGYVQTRWIQDTDSQGNPIYLTRDQWAAAAKTFNPDGTPAQTQQQEAFENFMTKPTTVITVGVLCLLALAFVKK
jgi:hypothetical protein